MTESRIADAPAVPIPADHDAAIAQLGEALERARAMERSDAIVVLLANIARQYFEKGMFDRTIECCQEALEIADEAADPHLFVMLHGRLASTYSNIGEYERAIDWSMRARELARRHGLNQFEVNSLLILSLSCHAIGDLEHAKGFVDEAIGIFEQTGDSAAGATVLLIASCLDMVGELRRAIEYAERGLHLAHIAGDRSLEASALLQMNALLDRLGERDDVRLDGEDALRTFTEVGSPWKLAPSLIERANRHRAAGELYAAASCCREGLALAGDARPVVSTLHRILYEVLKELGDAAGALEHFERHHEVHTTMVTVESQRRLHELRVRHELESARSQAEIAHLRADQLQLRFDAKQHELAAALMSLARQTELLGGFRTELRQILGSSSDTTRIVGLLREKLREASNESIDWVRIEAEFQGSYPEFRDRLVERHPALTKMEVRICSLVKVGLTTPDIARLLGLSERTIENHRFSIRRKLGLRRGEEIIELLATV